jgi:hypothetical protein
MFKPDLLKLLKKEGGMRACMKQYRMELHNSDLYWRIWGSIILRQRNFKIYFQMFIAHINANRGGGVLAYKNGERERCIQHLKFR